MPKIDLAAMIARNSGMLPLPLFAPPYSVTKGVTLGNREGYKVIGANARFPLLIWEGDDPTASLFDCPNSRDLSFEDFGVIVRGKLGSVFRHWRETKGGIPPTHCGRVRIYVRVEPGGWLGRVVHYMNALDENNEAGYDHHCDYNSADQELIRIEGSQSKGHEILGTRLNGNGRTKVGIRAIGGSFNVWGGGGAGFTEAQFSIEENTDPIAIRDFDADPSSRYLELRAKYGRTGEPQNLTIDGGRFMAGPQGRPGIVPLAADRFAMRILSPGPVLVRGWQLGGGDQPIPRILYDPPGIGARLDLEGVTFGAFGSVLDVPIVRENLTPVDAYGMRQCVFRGARATPDSPSAVYKPAGIRELRALRTEARSGMG